MAALFWRGWHRASANWSALVLFLHCLSCLFGLSGWSSRINQQALMDIFSLWHKEPQVSFTHVLFTETDEQRSYLLQKTNPRISAQLKTTLRPRQSLHSPAVAKARVKFRIIAEVWSLAMFLLSQALVDAGDRGAKCLFAERPFKCLQYGH